MDTDIRAESARYYDHQPIPYDDVSFYLDRLPSPVARVLELGCGTGRVLVRLAERAGFVCGLDASEAMLAVCREKLRKAGVPRRRALAQRADITNFDLARQFDLVVAPYRVFQNLESDQQVDGFFRGVRRHLARDGTCILNVFKPNADAQAIVRSKSLGQESLSWTTPFEDGVLECYEGNHRLPFRAEGTFVIYPRLIYRRYRGAEMKDEAVLDIAMRIYYPEEFEKLIVDRDFRVVGRWGGYAGEAYGSGPELVIEFADNRP